MRNGDDLRSNEVTGLQAGGYLVREGFGAPAGLKAGILNQQGKRISGLLPFTGSNHPVPCARPTTVQPFVFSPRAFAIR